MINFNVYGRETNAPVYGRERFCLRTITNVNVFFGRDFPPAPSSTDDTPCLRTCKIRTAAFGRVGIEPSSTTARVTTAPFSTDESSDVYGLSEDFNLYRRLSDDNPQKGEPRPTEEK